MWWNNPSLTQSGDSPSLVPCHSNFHTSAKSQKLEENGGSREAPTSYCAVPPVPHALFARRKSVLEHLFSSIVVDLWENSRQRDCLGGPWAAYFWSSSRLMP